MLERLHKYPVGSEIEEKSGRIKKKVIDGRWIGRGRWVMEKQLKRELKENEKVYHISVKKSDDRPHNLVVIEFRTTEYRLQKSRPIYIPKS